MVAAKSPRAHFAVTKSVALLGTYIRNPVRCDWIPGTRIVGSPCCSSQSRAGTAKLMNSEPIHFAEAAATRAWKIRSGDGGHSESPPSPRPWKAGTGSRNRTVKHKTEDMINFL